MTGFGLVAESGPVIPDFGEASDCVQENRLFCPDWVRDNWGEVLQPALLQHVKLTAIAVSVGFVIAFAAALVARRLTWFERPFDLVSALLYTVPSLALFQLLVPITGLTVTTVEVALVSYTLLILFRNILTGLRAVPQDVLEAARGIHKMVSHFARFRAMRGKLPFPGGKRLALVERRQPASGFDNRAARNIAIVHRCYCPILCDRVLHQAALVIELAHRDIG